MRRSSSRDSLCVCLLFELYPLGIPTRSLCYWVANVPSPSLGVTPKVSSQQPKLSRLGPFFCGDDLLGVNCAFAYSLVTSVGNPNPPNVVAIDDSSPPPPPPARLLPFVEQHVFRTKNQRFGDPSIKSGSRRHSSPRDATRPGSTSVLAVPDGS